MELKSRSLDEKPSIKSGVIWNVGALGFLAISGFALNILIGRFYSPGDLGLFNIVFALYILTSQFTTFGLQNSTLQSVSVNFDDKPKISNILSSALVSAVGINLLLLPIIFLLSPFIADIYPSAPNLEQACQLVIPGLFFFSLNKILLAAINGMRHMRAFSVFLALRYMLILVLLCTLISQHVAGEYLPTILLGAELILLPCLIVYLNRIKILSLARSKIWSEMKDRLRFGMRSFLAGAILELNTRVDVLMIGALLQTESAGIYTVALLLFDAGSQFISAIRNNLNPLIATNVASGKFEALKTLSQKIQLFLFVIFGFACLLVYYAFTPLIQIIFTDEIFLDAKIPALILISGLAMAGGGMVFNMSLNQSNRPEIQTLFILSAVIFNIVANSIFIPMFGISGAALGTITALSLSVFVNIFLCRKIVGIRILI